MIKIKLITYFEDNEKLEEIYTLKEFQDMFNRTKHDGLNNADRIEFIIE